MTNEIQQSVRFLAVELLTRIEQEGAYSNIVLDQTIKRNTLSKRDAHLLTNIVYGVLQNRLLLEYWLEPFTKKNKKITPWVKQLLLSALYQMKFLDKIPNHAILNESIEIAKRKGHDGIRKFVTGILHAILRQGVRDINEVSSDIVKMSLRDSVPEWLVKKLIKQNGTAKTTSILQSINQQPHQTVRINFSSTSKKEVMAALQKEKVEYEESLVTPSSLIITKGFIPESESYQQGDLIVQDESATLVVESMGVQPQDTILDACAAPGGKTVHIAEKLDSGKVTALDIHKHKVKLIIDNASRCGVADKVNAMVMDARKSDEFFAPKTFDKVLVDAPCSGLGLLRRKPEIRYQKHEQDLLNLQRVQLEILNKVAGLVKVGGILTYSTCSIMNEENHDVVEHFLKEHTVFECCKTMTVNNIKGDRNTQTLSIYPDDYGSDGFFIATLKKLR
ncbi:ribosomal RNA small subunit methyltransferase B [Liquorilactobacillus sucicola DSM 21376 = JCM 15457]|uniref:16S rRNA (cytosine(967)-C(5))-methyltransferase n=1 Tax=Liquorilactobacillus sucicola DSM 21376 = JCM 15457 TaxID=1423806 RepID=A0A023CU06_9LACO|nr:16S rRNA (cytosine(967)-C(5))-methyltransferase RsmB [Liquorilactobacillus sucicola]KRN05218.1 16S rRNA m(5)C 967 methyltransferase [Liquorilactobacillus sucicola DSM 21376 = JCM 15457]GAJ25277.1 ribosomal RNA small subunit methyltransferase B [Liquorilactobacillus sucicola DSM 21376 = JCM 15457]